MRSTIGCRTELEKTVGTDAVKSSEETHAAPLRPFPKEVVDANFHGLVVAFIMQLCQAREIFYLCEQPGDSLLYSFPPVMESADMTNATFTTTWQGAFGAECSKHTIMMSNIDEGLTTTLEVTRPDRPESRLNDGRFWHVSKAGWTEGDRKRGQEPHNQLGT